MISQRSGIAAVLFPTKKRKSQARIVYVLVSLTPHSFNCTEHWEMNWKNIC